ncbi:MAG TPA: MlaD family protein [Bryobacteraceae bacterium]|jgi:phospholipid/cholesterol/gamma-HCH transport system substrate-binding protein
MPASSKVRWSQLKVGLMTIAALIILSFLVFLMVGNLGAFRTKSDVYTYMSDSQSLAEGADVRLNGILIGKVAKVQLSGLSDPDRTVRITMQIDNRYLPSIPVDSQAGLGNATLLGAKLINIRRGMGQQTIQAGGELPSSQTAELEDIFQQSSSTLAALQLTIKKINGIVDLVESGKGTIGELLVDDTMAKKMLAILDTAQAIANEGQKVVANLNSDKNSVGKFLHDNNELYGQVHDSLAKINDTIDKVNNGSGTISKILNSSEMSDAINQNLADIHKMLTGIQAGEGTLGKWVTKDDLHDQVQTTLKRVDALIDKISNGQGTISKLLNEPTVADELEGVMRETQGLLKDFRANPKKFLHIKLGLF